MSDYPHLNDVLAPALQKSVDKKLSANEKVLMALAGASGEGLVVTDRRVFLLREKITFDRECEVDCLSYPLEQILGITVGTAASGGCLSLDLASPPVNTDHTVLYFPAYDFDRFDAVASRLRILIAPLDDETETTVSLDDALFTSASTQVLCDNCGLEQIPGHLFCSSCGMPQGKACGGCGLLITEGASFCPACGASSTIARTPLCSSCGSKVRPNHAFCTSCGRAQGIICPACANVCAAGWACCGKCGHLLMPSSLESDVESGGYLGTPHSETKSEDSSTDSVDQEAA